MIGKPTFLLLSTARHHLMVSYDKNRTLHIHNMLLEHSTPLFFYQTL
jgi:hypothetical protein